MVNNTEKGKAIREEILKVIEEYIKNNGFSPTVRELGAAVGLKSTATIHKHLDRLKEENKIDWNPTMPRTITIKL